MKALFQVRADAAQHLASFRAVQQQVRELTGREIDQACKDVARLCFVSYDPELWLNQGAVELDPLPAEASPGHRTSGPGAAANAHSPADGSLASRKEIAERILGAIEWISPHEGFCTCPGIHRHATGNGKRDCCVHLAGAPTVTCFHNSCREIIAAVNHKLRSDIGKAERSALERASDERGKDANAQAKSLQRFTIWRPSQFLEWTEPPDNHLLLPAYLTRGELTTLIGQGGAGEKPARALAGDLPDY